MAELPQLPGYMREPPGLVRQYPGISGHHRNQRDRGAPEVYELRSWSVEGGAVPSRPPGRRGLDWRFLLQAVSHAEVSHPDVSTAVWTEGEPASSSAAASAAWVTRLCTRPLRRAASVAWSLPSPYGIPITSGIPFS